jgi:hypothetical protein
MASFFCRLLEYAATFQEGVEEIGYPRVARNTGGISTS